MDKEQKRQRRRRRRFQCQNAYSTDYFTVVLTFYSRFQKRDKCLCEYEVWVRVCSTLLSLIISVGYVNVEPFRSNCLKRVRSNSSHGVGNVFSHKRFAVAITTVWIYARKINARFVRLQWKRLNISVRLRIDRVTFWFEQTLTLLCLGCWQRCS